MILEVVAFLTTKGVSQYGQLDAVILFPNVVDAPLLSHLTVLTSFLSSRCAFSFRKLSKSFSRTTVSPDCSFSISFFAPQYSQFKCFVPGAYFKFAPQSLHLMKFPTSAVFS